MPAQVALAVAVGVLEGPRVDLVDDGVPPPRAVRVRHGGQLIQAGACPLIAITTSELRVPGTSEVANRAQSHEPGGRRDLALGLAYPGAVARGGGGAASIMPPFASDERRRGAPRPRRRRRASPAGRTSTRASTARSRTRTSARPSSGSTASSSALVRARARARPAAPRASAAAPSCSTSRAAARCVQHIEGHRQKERGARRRRTACGSSPTAGSRRSLGDDRSRGQHVPPPGGRRASARGLRAVAWADDGIVEAIECTPARVRHRRAVARRGADRRAASSAPCSRRFVAAARRYRGARLTLAGRVDRRSFRKAAGLRLDLTFARPYRCNA